MAEKDVKKSKIEVEDSKSKKKSVTDDSKKKKKEKSEVSESGKKKKKDKSEISESGKKKDGGKKKKKDKSEISEADDGTQKKKKGTKRGFTFDEEQDTTTKAAPVKEIDRLRKSHYIREEKLTKLRQENATVEEVYVEMFAEDQNDKMEELEDEIKNLRKTLEKQNNKKNKLPPEAQLQIQNDWLEVHIREWDFKIESLESKFELVKRAHKNAIDALEKAQVMFTDKIEMETMREALSNKKNDLYEATKLIQELQKVAWSMLPLKIAKHCEEIEIAMEKARSRLDQLLFESYKIKMVTVSYKKELMALLTAISGENELKSIVQKKVDKQQTEFNTLNEKKLVLDKILAEGYNLLEVAGITYEEAVAKVASIPLDVPLEPPPKVEAKETKKKKKVSASESEIEPSTEDKGGRRKSIVAMDEKMNFLIEKAKELDAELAFTKKEIEKVSKEHAAIAVELKKVTEAKKDIEQLKKSKDTIGLQLQQEVVLRKTYYNEIEDLKGKIRVFSRCRPISKSELDRGNIECVKFPDKYTVSVYGVLKDGKPKEFQFDRVFPPETEQDDVFEDTSRLIQSAFDGFNVCIFAYGQTGSGKTHTLIGNLQHAPGIAPRSFIRLFDVVSEGKAKFSARLNCYMLELYNEKLLDLMANNAEYSDKLEIKKDQHGMVVVPGAELLSACSADELRDLFLKGNGNRHIASTKMNSESSRSHLIISIMIECTQLATGKIVRGKMSIIDLAGSERLAKSGVKGVGATEATAINMSLSALGDVISALTSGQPFIPYRNNKLTLLMQDSLGGNAKTLMFVNLSPVDYNATETCNSLVYAQRVKLIKNDAIKVADTEEIPKLQLIINRLVSGERIENFAEV